MPNDVSLNKITSDLIGAAIEVHRHLGPGLLERAYRNCLAKELLIRGIPLCSLRVSPRLGGESSSFIFDRHKQDATYR
jgi:hypothetical protein